MQSLWGSIMVALVPEELKVGVGCKRGKKGKRRHQEKERGTKEVQPAPWVLLHFSLLF